MTRIRIALLGLAALSLAVFAAAAGAGKPGPGGSTGAGRVFFPNPVAQLQNQTLTDQDDADYAALPSGADYIAPDGSLRKKR